MAGEPRERIERSQSLELVSRANSWLIVTSSLVLSGCGGQEGVEGEENSLATGWEGGLGLATEWEGGMCLAIEWEGELVRATEWEGGLGSSPQTLPSIREGMVPSLHGSSGLCREDRDREKLSLGLGREAAVLGREGR